MLREIVACTIVLGEVWHSELYRHHAFTKRNLLTSGDRVAKIDDDNRIVLCDGIELVQVGDVGKTFNLVAFGGNVNAHTAYATTCGRIKLEKPVIPSYRGPLSGRWSRWSLPMA